MLENPRYFWVRIFDYQHQRHTCTPGTKTLSYCICAEIENKRLESVYEKLNVSEERVELLKEARRLILAPKKVEELQKVNKYFNI